MSSEIIKRNITRLLNQRSWTINELEKKAGTNRNIYHIIKGLNSNPSSQLVQQIAKALNVDYREIIEDVSSESFVEDYDLLSLAFNLILDEIKRLPPDVKISFDSLSQLLQEVYDYALETENKNIDKNFVRWLIKKYYSSS